MSWLWIDWVDVPPSDAVRSVAVRTVGPSGDTPAGVLAFWANDLADRPGRALRVDSRLAAGGDPSTWISWCRADAEVSYASDEGAVGGAVRRCMSQPWPAAISSLLVDWSRVAGAISLASHRASVADDPFARVFPQRLLRVEAGALGAIEPPTGPAVTRYGSGNPWPWDRYAGQVR